MLPSDEEHEDSVSPEPLGPGEFLIEILKDAEGAGLEIESINGKLLVAKLKKGPMMTWNQEHSDDPERMVLPCDRIVRVNGTESDSNKLIDELKNDQRLKIVMRHAKRFNVCVERNGSELGMCVIGGNVKLDMLKISALRDGVVNNWNNTQPESAISAGDRIISVNGLEGDPEQMLNELRTNNRLDMTLLRPR